MSGANDVCACSTPPETHTRHVHEYEATTPVPEVDPGLVEVHELLTGHVFAIHQEPTVDFSVAPPRMTETVWGCVCGWAGQAGDDETPGDVHATHLARAVQAHVEGRVEAAVVGALEGAALEIERELVCCPGDDPTKVEPHHHICRWGLASMRIVRSRATSVDLAASTPDGGREGVRGGEGA